MSNLICRKTMMGCPTPGMCSPHGGCQTEMAQPFEHIDLGQFIDYLWRLKAERDELKTENNILKNKIQRLQDDAFRNYSK